MKFASHYHLQKLIKMVEPTDYDPLTLNHWLWSKYQNNL